MAKFREDYSKYDYWEVEWLNMQHLREIREDTSWIPAAKGPLNAPPNPNIGLGVVYDFVDVLPAYYEGNISCAEAASRLDVSVGCLQEFLHQFELSIRLHTGR